MHPKAETLDCGKEFLAALNLLGPLSERIVLGLAELAFAQRALRMRDPRANMLRLHRANASRDPLIQAQLLVVDSIVEGEPKPLKEDGSPDLVNGSVNRNRDIEAMLDALVVGLCDPLSLLLIAASFSFHTPC